jgi:iron(III) transport system substrate-binding protein
LEDILAVISPSALRTLVFGLAFALATPFIVAAQEGSHEWQKITEAGRKEGAVTIYSGQGLKQLNDLAARFKKNYGIDVQVVRAVENELWPRVDVEGQSCKGIADIMVGAAEQLVAEREAKGFAVPVRGPAFDNPQYNRAVRAPNGTTFETNAAVLTFSWNTELWPQGVKDYPDILNPALGGKIGVPQGQTPSQVDFYLYLTEEYGSDFIDKLAALKPQVYPGALPLGQAATSGEIAVAAYGEPLIDEKEAGAPVDWGLAPKPWGARFYGMVLKCAPHPDAAQLLANFIVTREGQEAIARKTASVLPNIPGTLTTTDTVRRADLKKLTPEFVKTFADRWQQLYIKK